MYRGNFKKSEEYATKALEIADEYNFQYRQKECYVNLSSLSNALHDYKKS